VVAFEDFDREYDKWEAVLADFGRRSNPPLKFQLAVGTYGDLLHWMDQQLVDVAILTSGVFATSQFSSDARPAYQYLATVGLRPAVSEWAGEDRRAAGYHFGYRSVCAVPADSPLVSIEDLSKAVEEGRVQFVFVSPFSVSGRIAPTVALRKAGISTKLQFIYSQSHTESIRMLSQPTRDLHRVGFVWDDALRDAVELRPQVRQLPFPALDALFLPHDVIAIRKQAPCAAQMSRLVESHTDDKGIADFKAFDDWPERYRVVDDWNRALDLPARIRESQAVRLDEIGQMLLHSLRSQPRPPRMAVVLSGGGAKCSYQIGAVAALEEKLADLRAQNPNAQVDINLVVGTSGGAINALPIAMGITATPEGRETFRNVWMNLDQRDIVRPSTRSRINFGIWFGFLQVGGVLLLATWFVRREELRGVFAAAALVVLACIELVIWFLPFTPWRFMGSNHLVHHAWLWCTFGIRSSVLFLLAMGLIGLAVHRQRFRRGSYLRLPGRIAAGVIVAGLLALPTVQFVTVCFVQQTFSGGQGIENALATEFVTLVDGRIQQIGGPAMEIAPGSNADRLKQISREIFDRDLLQRDMVVTGNCLEQSADSLPSDVYFYASSGPDTGASTFGHRGVRLNDSPGLLLDVVMGSGSIFPMFPPRRLDDFPEKGQYVELVDGGFAHNSPIEAAVLWGATHIVLIEATPQKRRLRRNLAENAAAAFTHLHKQTQLVDMRSKQQVVVFSLVPEPPHLCVLDFTDTLVEASIQRGYADAWGGSGQPNAGPQARFKKELGEPVFAGIN
jgi:predicted acylesterase/phospholipase RssA